MNDGQLTAETLPKIVGCELTTVHNVQLIQQNDGKIVFCENISDDQTLVSDESFGLDGSTVKLGGIKIMCQQFNAEPAINAIATASDSKTRRRPSHMLPKAVPTQRHPCPRCGKDYSLSKNMRRHLRLECGQEPQFPCTFCKLRFKRNNQLTKHIANRHSNGGTTK